MKFLYILARDTLIIPHQCKAVYLFTQHLHLRTCILIALPMPPIIVFYLVYEINLCFIIQNVYRLLIFLVFSWFFLGFSSRL